MAMNVGARNDVALTASWSEEKKPRPALPGRLVYPVALGIAAIWLLLDQATKALASTLLRDRVVDLGVLDLRLIHNEGGAFGLDLGWFPGVFILVTVAVVVLVARALPRTERLSLAAAYGLITGGALGNVVDRIVRPPGFPNGAVVDFFDLRWWPVFNVADVGIVVGAGLITVLLIRMDREERAEAERRTSELSVRPDTATPQH
jgi:signal peptidase II